MIISFVFYFLIVFTYLKFLEMIRCIFWTFSKGDDFANKIQNNLKHLTNKEFYDLLKEFNHPSFPGNILLTKPLGKLNNWKPTQVFIGIFFRFPVLMIILAILTFANINVFYNYILCFTLFFGNWLEAFHLLIYRYRFGTIDNLMNAFSVRLLTLISTTKKNNNKKIYFNLYCYFSCGSNQLWCHIFLYF